MWHHYVVECCDGSLYTGITLDLDRRMKQHNDGVGAKYTRSRRPIKLLVHQPMRSHSAALKREHAFRQLSREDKQRAVTDWAWWTVNWAKGHA